MNIHSKGHTMNVHSVVLTLADIRRVDACRAGIEKCFHVVYWNCLLRSRYIKDT